MTGLRSGSLTFRLRRSTPFLGWHFGTGRTDVGSLCRRGGTIWSSTAPQAHSSLSLRSYADVRFLQIALAFLGAKLHATVPAPYLRMPVDARSAAMGGGSRAETSNASGLWQNPALMGDLERPQLNFGYLNSLADYSGFFGSWAGKLGQ